MLLLAATIGLMGCVQAGCSSGADMTGTMAHRVSAWAKAAGVSATDATIADDIARISRARHSRDLSGLKTECAVLGTDVQMANDELPAPDTTLTEDLSRAYTAYGDSSADCYSGASSSDRGRLSRADAELARGNLYLARAKQRLGVFGAS